MKKGIEAKRHERRKAEWPKNNASMPSCLNASLACRLCGSSSLEERGPIFHPQPPTVAGVPIDLAGMAFQLLRCTSCGFQFKDPPVPEEKLLACYEQASASHWKDDPNPQERQFDVLRALIEEHAPKNGRRILDVGCFNGAILSYIGTHWNRFGVEPSTHAAQRARDRNITIFGPTVNEIPRDTEPFHVILLIDVAEHLLDPMAMFARLKSLVTPQGIVIVGTGDTDAWSWQMEASRYWYCSMTEHVSFFNQQSMEHIAGQLRLQSVIHRQLSHIRANPLRRFRKAFRNCAFEALRRSRGFGIVPLNRYLQNRHAPWWLTATDHMLHIMRRTD